MTYYFRSLKRKRGSSVIVFSPSLRCRVAIFSLLEVIPFIVEPILSGF